MSFDRRSSLRRIKPQRPTSTLHRREFADLPLVSDQSPAGRELLLDTCLYIDVLQGRTPMEVDRLLQTRIVNHSTVALSELTHLYGALDPAHAGTPAILRVLGRTLDDIPAHRLSAPSARASAEAGMLAGLVTRLTGQAKTVSLLNDTLLFLHAAETGRALLTGNMRDFDWLDQLLPGSGVILYRKVD